MLRGKKGWLPTLEDGQVLDLAELRRAGLLRIDGHQREGTMRWKRRWSEKPSLEVRITCLATDDRAWLRLQYTVNKRDGSKVQVDELFHLVARPQPLGGHRLLAVCPTSGRRCRCLYLPCGATHFRSRTGFDIKLQHHTQRLLKRYRLLEKRNKVAEKLFRRFPPIWREIFDGSDVPPRPKGMHLGTYSTLAAKWRLLNEQANELYEKSFNAAE
jgi:hypothetical protein